MAAKRNVLPGYLKRAGTIPAPCVRSMLAYWLGGAWAGAAIIPPQPPVEEQHAKGKKKKLVRNDNQDLLILIPCMLAVIESD